ncbi:MAG: hypothetical protein FGM29_03925 [Actinobacteria bacterium]|nr:hypothetical protein [Actinomycetota bacterium]
MIRFWGLATSPAGFWVDEAAVASQSMCVAETGRTAEGKIGLFAPLDAGYTTPLTLGASALWVRIAGDSISVFRALAGLVGLVGLGAVAWAAYLILGRRLNWIVAAILLLTTPWIFHLSRVYWDPIFAFALVAGMIAAWATWREVHRPRLAFLAGLFGGLAMTTYPPHYVSVPLSLLVLFAGAQRMTETRRSLKWVVGGLAAGLSPLIVTIGDSSFGARRDELAVWGSENRQRMGWSLSDLPSVVIENLLRHLNPMSLFIDGDANLRHNSGFGGVLSPVEALALLAVALVVLRRSKSVPSRLLLLVPIGFLPAALTWEGGASGSLPHYLRSIGASVPLLVLVLLGGESISRRFRARGSGSLAVCGLSLLFFVPFANNYFSQYAMESQGWFDQYTIDVWRDGGGWSRPNSPLAQQYFEMAEGGRSCRSFLDSEVDQAG